MTVLVLAEHDLGKLSPATARIVAAASKLGPIDLLAPAAVAADAARLAGVARVLTTDAATADSLVPLLAQLAGPYMHIVAAASSVGRDVIPRLAARLDLMPVTDVVDILGPDHFVRPIYAGNALETVRSPQPKQLLTIRASAFRSAATGNAVPVEPVTIAAPPRRTTHIADHRTEGDLPDLSTAPVVVAGGVSFASAENFRQVEALAKALGAAVGATRAAVDAGYAPNDWQVGQTGKIIAPDLYIAIGISGALQHLAGIQGAKKIIAINTDPEAPLMKLADLALVADLNTALPTLLAILATRDFSP